MTNNSDLGKWFSQFENSDEGKVLREHPVAYFSAEYALDSSLPTYAGGLGVLAGDFVRETAMRKFPLLAVGLLYKKAQSILTLPGHEEKHKLTIVLDQNYQEVKISLPLDGRTVAARAWQWEEGEAKVFLLDTDLPENDPNDRRITEHLYDEDRDMRLKQEILLGIGGFRLLAHLGHHASVYHLNEGHSAFLALELVRHEMKHQQVDFKEACGFAKKHVLFSNHTLVPAGQEQFAKEKVISFLAQYAAEIKVDPEDIARLGERSDYPDLFSMTLLSFNLSSKSNAVSIFHGTQAKAIWPLESMLPVTNGIFINKWDKIGGASDADVWPRHLENKRELIRLVKEKTGKSWSETDLILVWARRLVEYKQPKLFLEDPDKLMEIAQASSVQFRIVFSGPTREENNPITSELKEIIEGKLATIACFIPNYNLDTAQILTAGADVWLNTPIPGTEACGTSGMKAGLNGALALSTNDGWIHEVGPSVAGWVADSREELMSLFENKIIPLYKSHLEVLGSSDWVVKMKAARNLIVRDFSTSRMLVEYIEKLYLPILQQKHAHKID